MQPHAAGEEAVAVGVLDNVAGADARDHQGAHGGFLPTSHVFFGVGDDDGGACCAGTGLQSYDVFHGNGKQPEGIGVPKVDFLEEGQLLDVLHFLDAGVVQAFLLHAGPKERLVLVGVGDHAFEPRQLDRLQFVPAHEIFFR